MTDQQIPLRRHGLTHVELYDVTREELDSIKRESNDLELNFQVALFCFTGATSFFAALITTTPDSRRVFDVFVIFVFGGIILGAFFGIKWYRGRKYFSSTVDRILERQVGPLGQEGRELRPAELAGLPSQPAGPVQIPLQQQQTPPPQAVVPPEPPSEIEAPERKVGEHGGKGDKP